ncbi:MAG TPA: hypothetical protein VF988_00560 [Verrucomicrobiae bacterium]
MFQKAELKRLQAQKELLVLQSSANRLLLTAEWQQIRSPEPWREEAGHWLRRHPTLIAALAAAGGMMAARAVRKPAGATEGFGKLRRMASLGLMVWKLMRRLKAGNR